MYTLIITVCSLSLIGVNGQSDRQTDGRMDGPTDTQTDGRTDCPTVSYCTKDHSDVGVADVYRRKA